MVNVSTKFLINLYSLFCIINKEISTQQSVKDKTYRRQCKISSPK